MVKGLFDTNILIDYLNGLVPAKVELARYTDKAISLVTWMEVMVGSTAETDAATRGFLAGFTSLPIDDNVAALAVKLRKSHRIKLPDAIIASTALVLNRTLLADNDLDFLRVPNLKYINPRTLS